MRTLLRAGRILGHPQASSLIFDDDRIVAIGGPELAGPADRVLDAGAALVTPAFVDAHAHLTQTGLLSSSVDLRAADSLAAALNAVATAGAAAPVGIVLGGGWDEHGWSDGRPPTAAELQRAAGPDVPVWLSRIDAHSCVVSSAFLAGAPELAALAGFHPSGWLRSAANSHARRLALAALSPAQRGAAQLAALQQAAAAGVGCVHEMGTPELSGQDDLAALLAAEHPVIVIGYWGELGGVDTARRLGAAGAGGDLSCDGSVGSRTAWFSQPYRGSTDCGTAALDAGQVAEHVLGCTAAGLQAGFHAIGDAAVDEILAGMELAIAVDPAVRRAGHRIEHAELVSDVRRLAGTGLIASVQPAFDAAWGGPHGMYADRLGAQRAARMNDLAALHGAGVLVALGSDSPVTPFDPWGTVRAAAYPHNRASGISIAQAVRAHTEGGWRAARRSGGILRPGATATLSVWDCPPGESQLPDLGPDAPLPRCVATIVDGRLAFDDGLS